jgi:uncharacterized protein YdeI (BOF family)
MKSLPAFVALVLLALVCSAQADAQPLSLTGQVLETQDVQNYTYLRLQTATGEVWAAVPTTSVSKGAQVTIGGVLMLQNFESRSLKKTFDKIAFGALVDPNAHAAPQHGGSTDTASNAVATQVARASGPDAKTVAEVVAGKAALKDKPVAVRGQVVKVMAGILGKNWVHLRDGSGSPADQSNDILVTTQDTCAVGDVVEARGTVRTNLDLGSGYNYEVIIDSAVLQK